MTEEIEVIDETSEETQEEVEETTDTPTLEDYQKLLKENKTLKAQKEHFKKKATTKVEPNQTNTSPDLTREEAILFSKGYEEEDIVAAKKLAALNGTSITEAIKDDYIQSKVTARKQQEISAKAQLGASSGGHSYSEKPVSEMTEEEHRAYAQKITENI